MTPLRGIDLRLDATAIRVCKEETVSVVFAKASGDVLSREGVNRYARGDALILGSLGDRWSVSRDRFDAKYVPVPPLAHGEDGAYRSRPVPVLAKQMHEAFAIERTGGGDVIQGAAGDWLMQYAPGDYGIVAEAKFRALYRRV